MKRKFFLKNLVLFLIPLLIPLLILGSLSITISQHYIKDDINKNNLNLLKQTRENVELVLNELDPLSLIFDNNAGVYIMMDSILKNDALTSEEVSSMKILNGFLNAPQNARPYIHSIYIHFDSIENKFYSSSDGVSMISSYIDSSWYDSYKHQHPDKRVWAESRYIKQYSFEQNPQRIVTIYRRIEARQGVIVLNIVPRYIENIFNNLVTLPEQSLMVLNENGQIIFTNNRADHVRDLDLSAINRSKDSFVTLSSSGESYTVSQVHSSRYGWKYVSIIPQSALYQVPIKLSEVTFVLLVLSFILGLALTYYLTRRNHGQISNIISIIDSAESGKPLPPLPDRIRNEYGYIIHNILKTFIEQSYLKVSLSERKYKMKTMELTALQSQINPHFLFNTLKTIYWKSFGLTGRQNEVSEMIENLSDILNYSLGSPEKTVKLEKEIRTTQSYIDIQKVRYKDKFDVLWEYDREVEQVEVIKLILQPLIENSIYHGIKEKDGCSLIKIKISRIPGFIIIGVIDSGLGIHKDTLKKIRERLKEEGEYSEHIGLFNTNKRLKLTYGEEYGLSIRSKYGAGTAVYMKIPLSPAFCL